LNNRAFHASSFLCASFVATAPPHHHPPPQGLLAALTAAVSSPDAAQAALHNHTSWQGAVEAFQRRLASRFPAFRDIWLPFDLAVHQLRHGLGLVALGAAVAAQDVEAEGGGTSDAAVLSHLLSFPLSVGGAGAVASEPLSLAATIEPLLSLASTVSPVSRQQRQAVTSLRTCLVMAALARVRLWQAVAGPGDAHAGRTAADVISLVHRAWAVGQQEAAAAAAEGAEGAAKHYDGEWCVLAGACNAPLSPTSRSR
jgi:hypothetical protein